MGNPRHVAGLSFNVGNATEPGVSGNPLDVRKPQLLTRWSSLLPGHQTSSVHYSRTGSKRIATRPTPSAPRVMTPIRIKATASSMVKKRWTLLSERLWPTSRRVRKGEQLQGFIPVRTKPYCYFNLQFFGGLVSYFFMDQHGNSVIENNPYCHP